MYPIEDVAVFKDNLNIYEILKDFERVEGVTVDVTRTVINYKTLVSVKVASNARYRVIYTSTGSDYKIRVYPSKRDLEIINMCLLNINKEIVLVGKQFCVKNVEAL